MWHQPIRGVPHGALINETRDELSRLQRVDLLDQEGLQAELPIACLDCVIVAAEDVDHLVSVDQDELALVLRLELWEFAQVDLQLPFERHAAPRSGGLNPTPPARRAALRASPTPPSAPRPGRRGSSARFRAS